VDRSARSIAIATSTRKSPGSPWCKSIVAPRAVMRGMQRRSNANGVTPRAA